MWRRVISVIIRFELIIDVVSVVVGIVVDEFGRVEFSGLLHLQGKCCPNFCRIWCSFGIGFLNAFS